jgi:hypothetical protein
MDIPLIRVLKPKEAVQVLRAHGMTITEVKLDMGLQQGVFPFGDAVKMPGGEWSYAIYSALLDHWIAERSAMVDD